MLPWLIGLASNEGFVEILDASKFCSGQTNCAFGMVRIIGRMHEASSDMICLLIRFEIIHARGMHRCIGGQQSWRAFPCS